MSVFDDLENESMYSDEMPSVIREYLRDDQVSDNELLRFWKRSVSYIENYTGLSKDELDAKPELVQAMLAIVADMHDNRQYRTDISYLNELIDSILGLHCVNLV